MAINYNPGGDVSNSGKFVDQEGYYHFVIIEPREIAQKRDGSIIPGKLCQFECVVLESTVPNQHDKEWSVCLNEPRADMKDGGDFVRKVADRWWLALGVATRQQIEQKIPLQIDVAALKGRQFIAKLKSKDKYIDLDGADVFHVDDPAVKNIKKSVAHLAKIRPELRWAGAQSQAATKTTSSVDPDNL